MRSSGLHPATRMLAQRPWTARERNVVWRGLTGRLAIAIEPLLGTILLGLFAWGIVWRAHHVKAQATLIVVAPIFALGAVAFFIYFIALLAAPLVAYLQTYKPIYVVDGYVRFRPPDEDSAAGECGYVAVLFEDQRTAYEWHCIGMKRYQPRTIPAMVEFSVFGGIHSIDGKSTGLLPEGDLPLLAVGINQRH